MEKGSKFSYLNSLILKFLYQQARLLTQMQLCTDTLNIYGWGGNGTLNVQWEGTNETANAPAIWKVQHTH